MLECVLDRASALRASVEALEEDRQDVNREAYADREQERRHDLTHEREGTPDRCHQPKGREYGCRHESEGQHHGDEPAEHDPEQDGDRTESEQREANDLVERHLLNFPVQRGGSPDGDVESRS